MMRVSESLKLE
jgi:hypothetical protein